VPDGSSGSAAVVICLFGLTNWPGPCWLMGPLVGLFLPSFCPRQRWTLARIRYPFLCLVYAVPECFFLMDVPKVTCISFRSIDSGTRLCGYTLCSFWVNR
jgi:hypothetical protein